MNQCNMATVVLDVVLLMMLHLSPLDALPASFKKLDALPTSFKELAALPTSFKELAALPTSFKELAALPTSFKELAALPTSFTELECSHSFQLDSLHSTELFSTDLTQTYEHHSTKMHRHLPPNQFSTNVPPHTNSIYPKCVPIDHAQESISWPHPLNSATINQYSTTLKYLPLCSQILYFSWRGGHFPRAIIATRALHEKPFLLQLQNNTLWDELSSAIRCSNHVFRIPLLRRDPPLMKEREDGSILLKTTQLSLLNYTLQEINVVAVTQSS